jgi:type IV pilus assembly protein PilY1
MKNCRRNAAPRAALALALTGFASIAYGEIPLAQTPLFLSTSVTPNVMLLFDNSGSMDNIMWPAGYNPATTYPDWSRDWDPGDGNVFLDDLSGSGCSGGRKRGRKPPTSNQGTTKCLLLPDPVGNGNTRYNGNYLNYLFETYANNTNLTAANTIPQQTRMTVARNVATDLISENADLRWGLASFYPPNPGSPARTASGCTGNNPTHEACGPGGRIDAFCGATTANLVERINAYTSNSNTPLAETYYEITRYFRGLSSYYTNNLSFPSPVQYRCQKNFVIVLTDGFPTHDTDIASNDPDAVADPIRSLPNWDNVSPTTSAGTYPIFPQYSDGFQPSGDRSSEGYSLYLDDLAKFGYDIDLRKGGVDDTGVSYDDPEFAVQRLQTYTVGLALNNQMLQDAAEYGRGRSFTANTSEQLLTALTAAVNDIEGQTSAAASVATNSTKLTADTAVYQARFSTGDWSGQLRALPITLTGEIGDPLWDAADGIPAPAQRSIFTYNAEAASNRGRPFQWTANANTGINNTQKAALNRNAAGVVDNHGQLRLNYLRGVQANEAAGSTPLFRTRTSLLGDIVNSDPAFVGRQDYGFERIGGAEGSSYQAYRASNAYVSRPPMIYVGANDGMVHAIRADTGPLGGREVFAYVPNLIFDKLSALTATDYNQNHRYYVDGPLRVLDAYFGNQWHTILVGGLGGGGRGVYALNVTNPESFEGPGRSDVLWEFGAGQDADMGFSYPQPTIARLANGQWAAIVANGYNSGNGRAVLFVINLSTGNLIRKFDTLVGNDNGLSSPVPVDLDGDRITDVVYAGDLKGNLWKFDLRSQNPAEWSIAYSDSGVPRPLFTACTAALCTAANRQPITARPEVGLKTDNIEDGVVVYVGTGRYFAASDNTTGGNANSFYGIFDADDLPVGSSPPDITRADLLEQRVLGAVTRDFDGQVEEVRITTDNELDEQDQGWYIDLPLPGERQVSQPILRNGSIIFTTLIPNTAACSFGGTSFLMEIDALSGSRLDTTPFDLNRDGSFDEEDYATITLEDGTTLTAPVSGRRSTQGIIKTPAIIAAPGFEIKVASGTAGGIDTTIEAPQGATTGRRLSWRQTQ